MPKMRPASERVWKRIVKGGEDDCWIWTGNKTGRPSHPYGSIGAGGQGSPQLAVHRVVYEVEVGPIPDGLQLDHLCRNTLCCNPRHLEPVTSQENNRRRHPYEHWNAAKTHCKHGHEFTPENTFTKSNGGRSCRTCHRDRNRDGYHRRRAS